jgi:hypothetical protein
MNVNERFNVLAQGVMLAQKNGVLSLDEAVEAKSHIDSLQKGENIKESLTYLVKVCELAQRKGIFSIQDSHFLYLAIDGMEEEVDNFLKEREKTIETPADNGDSENTDDKQNKKKGK